MGELGNDPLTYLSEFLQKIIQNVEQRLSLVLEDAIASQIKVPVCFQLVFHSGTILRLI